MADRDDLTALVRTATELLGSLDRMKQEMGDQLVVLANQGRTNRRMIWALGVSFVLIAAMIVAMLFALERSNRNARNIEKLTDRIHAAQTVDRQRGLCPLYKLFIDSQSPEARERSVDPEQYDAAFRVIHKGYNDLNCQQFLE
jgi:hypothetical protein